MNYRDQSGRVWYLVKVTHDNDVTDRTGAVYTKNDT